MEIVLPLYPPPKGEDVDTQKTLSYNECVLLSLWRGQGGGKIEIYFLNLASQNLHHHINFLMLLSNIL
jgi:hypothetical protein